MQFVLICIIGGIGTIGGPGGRGAWCWSRSRRRSGRTSSRTSSSSWASCTEGSAYRRVPQGEPRPRPRAHLRDPGGHRDPVHARRRARLRAQAAGAAPPARPAVRRPPPRSRGAPDGLPILDIQHVSKFFGGLAANSDVSFSMEEGIDHGPHRPERRRQDHPLQLHHRLLPAFPRRDPVPRPPAQRPHPGPGLQAGHGAHLAEGAAAREDDGARQRDGGRAGPHQQPQERDRDGAPAAALRAAGAQARAPWPAACPSASARSWRWRASWPPSRSCSCSTR